MKIGKTLYVSDRKKWREWLRKNHAKAKEIWLVYYKKVSGKPRIPYNDAVEEALSYGWIDSTVKSIDEKKYAQRFSPRKKTSSLSQSNIEKIKKLIKQKKMTKAGLRAIEHAYKPAKNSESDKFKIPEEITNAIKADSAAWKHFRDLPDTYKRIRIAYIIARKKHSAAQYNKALRHFIKKTAANKRYGIVTQQLK